MTAVLDIQNLRVGFDSRRRHVTEVLHGISFRLDPGECLALVGESGSGKSVTARTTVGLTGERSRITADRLLLNGRDVTGLPDREWRRIRGAQVGFVLQDALASLDPLRTVGQEVGEPLQLHTELNRAERRAKVLDLLTSVGVPEPELRAAQHPFQLSGGLRQRALIASAIACGPDLLIADEPTTALDATIAAQVLDLLAELKTRSAALLVVSHDLAVVARLADRVAVMQAGEIVEQGPTDEVLASPQHPYTRALLAAVPTPQSRGRRLLPGHATSVVPRPRRSEPAPGSGPVITVNGVSKAFRGPDGIDRTVVKDVSFAVSRGTTVGVVGESGSGKTTCARLVLGVEKPDTGSVLVHGLTWSEMGSRDRQREHRQLQAIYQDPLSSFDPRYTVRRVLGEALQAAGRPRREAQQASIDLLHQVGIGSEHLDRRPRQLSGGQRQRVAIARALAAEPEVIVCDEPVSALDVSVQAQILDLLQDLKEQLGLAYLFISHDLGVVHHLADEVLVMKDGAIVESGPAESLFADPQHDYTKALLSAVPRLSTTGAHA